MTKSCCRVDDEADDKKPRLNLLKIFAESLLIVLLPLDVIATFSHDIIEAVPEFFDPLTKLTPL